MLYALVMPRMPAPLANLIDAINRGDLHTAVGLMAEDIVFVDNRGHRLVGREDCIFLVRQLFDSGISYRTVIEDVARTDADWLLRGRTESDFSELNQRVLWRARLDGEKVSLWEAHTSGTGGTLIESLARDRIACAA
mgnify:CR=1 FL=1